MKNKQTRAKAAISAATSMIMTNRVYHKPGGHKNQGGGAENADVEREQVRRFNGGGAGGDMGG
jgi:hypothetical protein